MTKISEQASAGLPKAQRVNSLSLRNCGIDSGAEGAAVVARGPGNRKTLIRVIGIATDTDTQRNRKSGDVSTALVGDFKATRISDKQEFVSVKTFLLGGAHDVVRYAVENMIAAGKPANVPFGVDVFVYSHTATKENEYGEAEEYTRYDFDVDWLREPPRSNALDAFADELPDMPEH